MKLTEVDFWGKEVTEKKELHDYAVGILNKRQIPYIHIPNRIFKGKYGKSNLKYFPDIMFAYNGRVFQREFGLPKRHTERKEKQLLLMRQWEANGVDIKIIYSRDKLEDDFKNIGVM